MKKFVVFALISAMCVSMAACSNSDSTSSDSSSAGTSESSTAGETSSDAAGETSGEAKVGFSITPTLSAESEEATFSTVYAAVMVDADGKILACDIDESEFAPALTDGAVGEVDLRTKMEKGDDYGMSLPVLPQWNGTSRLKHLKTTSSARPLMKSVQFLAPMARPPMLTCPQAAPSRLPALSRQ